MSDNQDTQEIPKITVRYRCTEFLRIRDQFDKELSYMESAERQRTLPVEQGQIFRVKRAKARRLNYHLSTCLECG